MAQDGLILKGIGGFYYVEAAGAIYECKARGIFRSQDIKPVAGDRVTFSLGDDGKGIIEDILPRKNFLVRPPIANIDTLFFIVSTTEPLPNTFILDKLIAIAEYKDIAQAIVITKVDLERFADLYEIYTNAGFAVLVADYDDASSIERIRKICGSGINAFCGNSGVGKSTLLNAIDAGLNQETGEISKKLGRGKHTTRSVELFKLKNGGYIADSPGFSSLELNRFEIILKDQLQFCFREFADYIDKCKYTGCSHTSEKGCAVLDAVNSGAIPASRHESYVKMYEDAKNIKEWEHNL